MVDCWVDNDKCFSGMAYSKKKKDGKNLINFVH